LQLLGGFCVALLGQGEGAAGFDPAGGGVAGPQPLLQLRHHLLIQGRGHGSATAASLQLIHQTSVVVALLAALDRVVPGAALAYPEVRPALRQLGDAAPLHRGVVPQQLGQTLFGGGAAEGGAAAAAQLAGAAGSREAFAHLPELTGRLEANLDLRQAGVDAGAQLLHTASGGGGPQEQTLVQRLHQGALARFVGAANQGELPPEAHLQVAVLANLPQPTAD